MPLEYKMKEEYTVGVLCANKKEYAMLCKFVGIEEKKCIFITSTALRGINNLVCYRYFHSHRTRSWEKRIDGEILTDQLQRMFLRKEVTFKDLYADNMLPFM